MHTGLTHRACTQGLHTGSRLTSLPGIRFVEICPHPVGELTGMDIGNGGVLEDIAHCRSQRYPDLAEMVRSTCVVDILRAQISDGCERTIECSYDVGDGDGGGIAFQAVAPICSALTRHEACLA